MKGPEVCSLMSLLNDEGDPLALFVGGCVRNALLKVPCTDIDIATIWTPTEVTIKAGVAGFEVIPTGLDHGTVTVLIGECRFEVTTLRRDVSTDGRRATVEFTSDWLEDAERRDFYMTALYMDTQGNVYDPTGCGLDDIQKRVVRFAGDAAQRIKEDALRILRFFRFAAQYDLKLDKQDYLTCMAYNQNVKTLSKERVTQEFNKMLQAKQGCTLIQLMFGSGILSHMPYVLWRKEIWKMALGLDAKYLLLANYDMQIIEKMEQYVIFTNDQKKGMTNIKEAMELMSLPDVSDVKESIYQYGHDTTWNALHLVMGEQGRLDVRRDLEEVFQWEPKSLPIDGNDIINAGFPKGATIGKILKEVEDWWIGQDYQPDVDACLQYMNDHESRELEREANAN